MRFKKRFLTIISLIMCLSLTACETPALFRDFGEWLDEEVDGLGYKLNGTEPEEFTFKDPEPYVPKEPVINIEPEVNEQVITIEDGQGDDETDETVDDDAVLEVKLADDRYYAYGTLTQEERRVYRKIYATLSDWAEKTPMGTLDADLIDRVFTCVLADNPEFFYVRGYNLIRYERGGVVEKMAVSGLYTMGRDEAVIHQQRADTYVASCLAGVPDVNDDYEKIKYLYEYIITHTEYDLEAENGQNYLSVFENGRSVCQGYATAMQYMMLKLGLFCTVVRGVTNSGENHAWNLVKSNGDYYYVDVTWGDMSYDLRAGDDIATLPVMPEVSYEYLCVTTDDISTTHTLDMAFVVPQCTARYDNYFVRMGCYFTEVNEEQLSGVFSDAYARGDSMVYIKCSNAFVYLDMKDYLTGNRKVFDYLDNKGNVNYVCLDNLNELIFYI
ncbi:MAG: hypothetical protein K5857_08120 [Lachnospiraceae bacterium]|nr:hypothetical protein [Lachnospiraceae bacterium]